MIFDFNTGNTFNTNGFNPVIGLCVHLSIFSTGGAQRHGIGGAGGCFNTARTCEYCSYMF